MIKTQEERERHRREIMDYNLMLSGQVIELCETEATPRQEEFLHCVLGQEIARRECGKKGRLLNRAGFPVLKSFDEYDFLEIRLPQPWAGTNCWLAS